MISHEETERVLRKLETVARQIASTGNRADLEFLHATVSMLEHRLGWIVSRDGRTVNGGSR
jgi:hypothetical protein